MGVRGVGLGRREGTEGRKEGQGREGGNGMYDTG